MPSARFDHDRNIFKCFSGECQLGGTALKFYRLYQSKVNGVYVSEKQAKMTLGVIESIDRSKISLTLKRKDNFVVENKQPFYEKYQGIDRIKAIQGYAVDDQDFKWYLD